MDDGSSKKTVLVINMLSVNTIGLITWIVFMCLKYSGAWDIPLFWAWFPLWVGPASDVAFIIIVFVIIELACFVAWLVKSHNDQRRGK